MKQTLEQALTKRAWRDPDFARLLETDPRSALEAIGVEVSGNDRSQGHGLTKLSVPSSWRGHLLTDRLALDWYRARGLVVEAKHCDSHLVWSW